MRVSIGMALELDYEGNVTEILEAVHEGLAEKLGDVRVIGSYIIRISDYASQETAIEEASKR